MSAPEREPSVWSTAELAVRLVLALAFVTVVLQTALPGGRGAAELRWLACGMLAGVQLAPSVRQRVIALAALTGVWTIWFMVAFVVSDPRAADLSWSRLVILALTTAGGGLLGSAAAFVGLIVSSGWPSRPAAPAAALGAEDLCVVFDAGVDDDGEEGRAGIVEAAGAEIDPSWIGRRVLLLTAETGDRVIVRRDGVIPISP